MAMDIEYFVNAQRDYFLVGNTMDIKGRKKNLIELRELLFEYKEKIINAFRLDFNKSEFDVITTEFSMVISEIDYMLKNIDKFAKPKKVKSNFINFPSKGYKYYEPYGVVLIISPWNYPLQLSFVPLIDAIAAGNTVILKPSEHTYYISKVMDEILSHFEYELVKVMLGGADTSQQLLEQRFDLIFFTGGDKVGRIVMEKASRYLTPVVLELGGKSPCIVDETCDLDLAVKRIVWGKYLNAGQTCVAPDYILVHRDIHQQFVEKVITQIKEFYYENDQLTNDFPYIINEHHVNRLKQLIDPKKVVFGGEIDKLLITPTVIDHVSFDDKIMSEEIFGPLMPIIEYDDIKKITNQLREMEHPLALYIFSNNQKTIDRVLENVSFGGGCINDVIMHLTNEKLPFGGVGSSGMGSYHGEKSFYTFSHEKSIFIKGKKEINLKYPPYSESKLKLIKTITNSK